MENQKQQIIKTAGEMFFRLGIRSVSIDDICRELGMSKKTFYVYFAGKDELVAQLLQSNIDCMAVKLRELLELHDFRKLGIWQLEHYLPRTFHGRLWIADSASLGDEKPHERWRRDDGGHERHEDSYSEYQ